MHTLEAREHAEARQRADRDGSGVHDAIDLLLEVEGGVVIVDHKSLPGRSEQWAAEALGYAPQVGAYQRALRAAGKTVLASLVHFPVGGGVVELACE